MQSNVNELMARMDRFGENLRSMQSILQVIGDEIVEDTQLNYIASGLNIRSSNLFRSIRANATGSSLTFGMLDYGAYNNYGVMPTPSFKYGGDSPTKPPGRDYFRYSNRPGGGLPSRKFYDQQQITKQVIDSLTKALLEPLDN